MLSQGKQGFAKALLVKAPLVKGFCRAYRAFAKAPVVKHPIYVGKQTEMCVCLWQARGSTSGFTRAFAKPLSSESPSSKAPRAKGFHVT